jgi:hypothetical protein
MMMTDDRSSLSHLRTDCTGTVRKLYDPAFLLVRHTLVTTTRSPSDNNFVKFKEYLFVTVGFASNENSTSTGRDFYVPIPR